MSQQQQAPAPATAGAGHPPEREVAAAAIATQQHEGAEHQRQDVDIGKGMNSSDAKVNGSIEGHAPNADDASVPPSAPPSSTMTNHHQHVPPPAPPAPVPRNDAGSDQPINGNENPAELFRGDADTTMTKESSASVVFPPPTRPPVVAMQHAAASSALPLPAGVNHNNSASLTLAAAATTAAMGPSGAAIGARPEDVATLASTSVMPTAKPPTVITADSSSAAKRKFDQVDTATDVPVAEMPAPAAKTDSSSAPNPAFATALANTTSIAATSANPGAITGTGPTTNPAASNSQTTTANSNGTAPPAPATQRQIQLDRPLSEMPRRKKPRPGNQHQCGSCDYCMVDECGTCKACLDMPRFGGKNLRRQKCFARPQCPNRPAPSPKKRKTKNPAPLPAAAALPPLPVGAPPMTKRTKPRKPTASSCGKCQNCVVEDCGSCLHCLDNPRFGGIGKLKKGCMHRPKCLEYPKQVASPPKKSHVADIVLQGVPPDRFNMSEILSFPVVFSYHVPTASRTAPIVPIAQTLTIASEVVEALDKSPPDGPQTQSTNATSGDSSAEKDEGLKAPPDVVIIESNTEKSGESTEMDTASIAKDSTSTMKEDNGSKSEGIIAIVEDSSCSAGKDQEPSKGDVVAGTENTSNLEHSGSGENKPGETQNNDAPRMPPRAIITEEEAEASHIEAERQQKQWDRLMKSSIARFARRRAGGKNYSRLPGNTNRSKREDKPSSDNEHTAEGVRRSQRKRSTKSRRLSEQEDDDDDEDYSEGERDSVTRESFTSSDLAKELPSGWTLEKVARSCGLRTDRFWYSPILQKKFRSRVDVARFLAKMEIAKNRLGIAKTCDISLPNSADKEKAAGEASEVSETRSPSEEEGQKEVNSNATDFDRTKDQAKVEELAWTLLLEDRGRRR